MTNSQNQPQLLDLADISAAHARAIPLRDGDEPWKVAELRAVAAELNSEVARLEEEFRISAGDLSELLQATEGSGDDQADAGAQALEKEQEMSIFNNTRELLQNSIDALNRIRAGGFGVCASCGAGVGKKRLQAFPRATLCLECKQREERR